MSSSSESFFFPSVKGDGWRSFSFVSPRMAGNFSVQRVVTMVTRGAGEGKATTDAASSLSISSEIGGREALTSPSDKPPSSI